MRKVAVLQSNYVPWKGYFDIVHDVDLFVFYDEVQYTKNDWRNRNLIKTPNGTQWLTVPSGSGIDRRICDVEISNRIWAKKHWKTLCQYYSKAPFFNHFREFFEDVYLGRVWSSLSELNQYLIREIAQRFLGIKTEFRDSRHYGATGERMERLLDLLERTGAEFYVSGPSARDYIEDDKFRAAGIELSYKDYTGYPEYSQFHPPFDHHVTVLDLLFHVGPEAPHYIWGWRSGGG